MTPLNHIYAEGHVAAAYGLEEAIFLHALMFWYRTNRGNGANFRDGRWWTYNSVKAFESVFPWWNGGQIRRIIGRCKDKGALLSGDYNDDRRDRTAWYTPSDELLAMYGESDNCICRKQQMQMAEPAGESAENGKCNIRKPWGNHGETDMGEPPVVPQPGDGEREGPAKTQVDKPAPRPDARRTRFVPPDVEQVRAYCRERGNGIDPEAFVDHYTAKGWMVGRSPMKDWRAAVRTWEQRRRSQGKEAGGEDDWFE